MALGRGSETGHEVFFGAQGNCRYRGGTAAENDKSFQLTADLGSVTYGICSSLFLDKAFKTLRYELPVTLNEDGTLSYEEDTHREVAGKSGVFHHTDRNTLTRVTS